MKNKIITVIAMVVLVGCGTESSVQDPLDDLTGQEYILADIRVTEPELGNFPVSSAGLSFNRFTFSEDNGDYFLTFRTRECGSYEYEIEMISDSRFKLLSEKTIEEQTGNHCNSLSSDRQNDAANFILHFLIPTRPDDVNRGVVDFEVTFYGLDFDIYSPWLSYERPLHLNLFD